ncbi:haloacid dehalogenase superfamily, subfamily IA, variant 3 with third motif having DD or ED [Microlunatus sagamiharensis]|uniref:Haloacid dehalogenase superfamily, subfamily IA, variant 3 with third motif having DD or ED n=1 Tax=Microlunatus sagamiharensis TaxID=546874 RepID=A0A1H2LQZ9_9ACTN|nr:HAD-IA family hydrolase [Microlunatus sagamiharensis]SDU83359.1 haloacid dehalogenase superfamily, subfamily IA, variant 3 with third motif having DD or ED [Microlunatus sagamiharensis]
MPTVLFGSISTVADTSELQRAAFNQAFADHGLDWRWDRDEYAALLTGAGGRDRIASYAAERGVDVDADAVHATKSSLFQRSLATADLAARPGVLDTVRGAKGAGLKVGFVTSTSAENVAAVLSALGPELGADDFDVITDSSTVPATKPDPAPYLTALSALGESAEQCVAIEDNVDGVAAARAAGVACVAFPNDNTAGHDFSAAQSRVDHLELAQLRSLIPAS